MVGSREESWGCYSCFLAQAVIQCQRKGDSGLGAHWSPLEKWLDGEHGMELGMGQRLSIGCVLKV